MEYHVGFVGFGTIGFPICRNLAQSGIDIVAYDAKPRADRAEILKAAGVRIVTTPREVSSGRNVIMTVLPDSEAVEQILLNPDLLEHLERGTICVEMSSGYPQTTIRIAKSLAERGGRLIDAPICNGAVPGAYERKITLCVGGEGAILEQVRPLLDLIASNLIYIGPLGSGHAVKIVNNSLAFAFYSIVAEAAALGVAYGIDQDKLISTLLQCSAAKLQFESASKQLLGQPEEEVMFQLHLATKDLRYSAVLAGELGAPHPVTDAAHSLYETAERILGVGIESATAPWNLLRKLGARQADKSPTGRS